MTAPTSKPDEPVTVDPTGPVSVFAGVGHGKTTAFQQVTPGPPDEQLNHPEQQNQEKAMSRWRRNRPKGRDHWINEPDYEIRNHPGFDEGAPTLWAVSPDDGAYTVFHGLDSASARELAENVDKLADALHTWEASPDRDSQDVD